MLSIFPLTSFSLAGTILTFVAAFLAFLAFLCDIALLAEIKQLLKGAQGYDVSSGPGFWLTFISVVFLLAASCFRFAEDRRESRGESRNTSSGLEGNLMSKLRGKVGY